MLNVTVNNDSLCFGDNFSLNFRRTLRIPDDDKTYPLPPSLGKFPICRVEDYRDRVPESWLEHGGVFIPMYQREALWILFNSCYWKPNALKIAVGKINAISGKPWNQKLQQKEADYIVAPPQPWLDGINAGDGYVKQFVAMPLGMGYTVEGQITGNEEFGGIQIIVYEPKPGKFSEPITDDEDFMYMEKERGLTISAPAGGQMGIAAGGKMKQKIYPDPYGIDTWDEDNYGQIYVHIVNSWIYCEITGKEPPSTPVTAKTYAKHKLPWFNLYDETMSDVAASSELTQVKTVKEMDTEKGFDPQQDDNSVDISDSDVINHSVQKPDQVKNSNQ